MDILNSPQHQIARNISYRQRNLYLHVSGHDLEINLITAGIATFALVLVAKAITLLNGLRLVNYLPGLRPPFTPLSLPGALLPTSWWNAGKDVHWIRRFHLYKDNENISIISLLSGKPMIYTSNIDVARQVAIGGHKTKFVKPESASRALLLWGMNLVASDGEMWRKHRRIMGPAFSGKLYELVWTQTLKSYREMIIAENWKTKDVVEVPAIQALTFKAFEQSLALLVLGTCGFGFLFNWSEPPRTSDGSMSVQEALRIVADNIAFVIFAPKWIMRIPLPRIQEAKTAHDQLGFFMREQAAQRKSEIQGQTNGEDDISKNNAFTLLVKANEDDTGKFQLDDQELIGNVYIMLFAGHETTAHTLAATLGFLAIYPEIQNEVLHQIIAVVGRDRDPVYDDYSKLDKVLAVFYEALRMFPAGHLMIREATEDTIIRIPNPVGQEGTTTMPIPKGLTVVVDMVGVQYNPRYFDEPEKFKPSRWYGLSSSDSEAFTAFSIGPRACIGRKFATTEAVCFLTMLIRDWEINPLLRDGETKEAWRHRVLDASIVITLGVKDVPVTFTRRR